MRFIVRQGRNGYFNLVVFISFIFGLFFWIVDLVYFKMHYGFSYEEIYLYFFGDFEYPEPISLSAVLEDIHIYMFMYLMFNVLYVPLFIRVLSSERISYFYSALMFIFSFISVISDILIYYAGDGFIYVKIVSFTIYKIVSFLSLIVIGLLPIIRNQTIHIPVVNMIVALFALGSVFFLLFNILIFYEKIGFNPQDIFYYYNGNPDSFIKGKSIEGLLSLFNIHLVAGAVFLFVIGHFFIFCELPYKKIILALASISMLLEFGGGLLLKTDAFVVSYLKLFSFIVLELLLIFMSVYIIKEILKGRLQWSYRKSSREP